MKFKVYLLEFIWLYSYCNVLNKVFQSAAHHYSLARQDPEFFC